MDKYLSDVLNHIQKGIAMTHTDKICRFFSTTERASITLADAVNMGVICLSQTIGRMEKKGYKFDHIQVRGKPYFAYFYRGWSEPRPWIQALPVSFPISWIEV